MNLKHYPEFALIYELFQAHFNFNNPILLFNMKNSHLFYPQFL
jgi:hypothetical protein